MPVEKTWYLYMVRCGDNSLYTGIALDVVKRFAEHEAQGPRSAKYLRGRTPLSLVYTESVGDKSAAARREREVKKMPKKLKELLICQAASQILSI